MAASCDVRDSVKRYLNALKAARTDSEKFAALLVIAQIEKNLKLTVQERKAVYGSIELTFIKRLINSQKEPEDCEKGTLASLGVTILSCMVNEIEDANKNPEILRMIPHLLGIIYEKASSGKSREGKICELEKEIIENSFRVLLFISSSKPGCKCITHCWALKSKTPLDKDILLKMIHLIVTCLPCLEEDSITAMKNPLEELLSQASSYFALSQDEEKFALLDEIFKLVSACLGRNTFDENTDSNFATLQHLRKGLLDIIQSKVNIKYRHLSLKLVSVLIEVFGVKWTFIPFKDEDEKISKKFLHLLVSLTSIEIKMIFLDKSDDVALMSYLFSTIENVIESLSANKHDVIDAYLGEHVASKILQTISAISAEVIYYLDEVKETMQAHDACQDMKINACVRLLCAYMSEETQALEKEVEKIAPYLIELVKASFVANGKDLLSYINSKDMKLKPAIIFIFMLPVLCHWSADDKMRSLMLESDLQTHLWDFFKMLFSSESEAIYETLETLIGIFMNIAITEPKLAADTRSIFGPMLEIILLKMNQFLEKPDQLLMNIATLGVIVGRAQLHSKQDNIKEMNNFFQQCLQCYYRISPCSQSGGNFDEMSWSLISELWFVGMDNLKACVNQSKELRSKLKEDPIFIQIANSVDENNSKRPEYTKAVYAVLKSLFETVSSGK